MQGQSLQSLSRSPLHPLPAARSQPSSEGVAVADVERLMDRIERLEHQLRELSSKVTEVFEIAFEISSQIAKLRETTQPDVYEVMD